MAGDFSLKVSAAVRAELARAEVKTAELAELLGVSTNQAGRRRRGLIPYTVDELYVIARHLDLPVSLFLADAERVA